MGLYSLDFTLPTANPRKAELHSIFSEAEEWRVRREEWIFLMHCNGEKWEAEG